MCHASKERVLLFGTDQRITSGPAARTAAFKGRIHGCTRTIRGNVRFFSCIAGAVHTWHFDTKSPGRLQIDDELELSGLHDWQVGGLRALEDLTAYYPGLTIGIRNVGSVVHEPGPLRHIRAMNRSPGSHGAQP
jgi:hypothetical protein